MFASIRLGKSIVLDVIGWTVYLLFWLSQYSIAHFKFIEVLQFTLFQMLFHIVSIYFNNYVLVQRLLYNKRYVQFILFYLLLIVFVAIVLFYLNSLFFYDISQYLYNYNTTYEGITSSIFLTAFAISFPSAFKINYDRMKYETRATQLMNDKIREELKFLKTQINPHFLFNSLNTVYNLIDNNSEEAKNTLVKFSEILRYALYETSQDTISIHKEFEYIKGYVAIEKIRKGKSLEVKIIENIKGFFEVPPMMLLTFVENAFKHVSNYQTGNFIEMYLEVTNTTLELVVKNSKDSFTKNNMASKPIGGIGLENIKRRLELLYPNKYELSFDESEEVYEVKLKLFTDEQ